MIPKPLIAPYAINVLPIIFPDYFENDVNRISHKKTFCWPSVARPHSIRHSIPKLSSNLQNSNAAQSGLRSPAEESNDQFIPFSFNEFASIYSGDFSNDEQLAFEPTVQFARKLHIPVHAPSIGNNCYFVKEVTRRNGRTQYRLRIASFDRLHQEPELVFRGKHYDFRDPAPFEKEMKTHEYIALAKVLPLQKQCTVILRSDIIHFM
jgi:hypothetical protein